MLFLDGFTLAGLISVVVLLGVVIALCKTRGCRISG